MLENIEFKSTKTSYTYTATSSYDDIIIPINLNSFVPHSVLDGDSSKLEGVITCGLVSGATEAGRYRFFEKNIYSMIKSLEILHNGNHIEMNDQFAFYHHMIADVTKTPDERYEESIFLCGKTPDLDNTQLTATTTSTDPPGTDTYTTTIENQQSVDNVVYNNCFSLGFDITNDNENIYFSIPLKHFMSHSIPLSSLKGKLEIRLKINHIDNIFVAYDNTEHVESIILSEMKFRGLVDITGGRVPQSLPPHQIHARTYAVEKRQLPIGTSHLNMEINTFKFKNVHKLLFFFSNPTSSEDLQKFYYSQRSKASLGKYQIEYGNKKYPHSPIDNVAKMFVELRRCFPKTRGVMTMETFDNDNSSTGTDSSDLDSGPPVLANQKRFVGSVFLGGLNMSEENVKLHMTFETIAPTEYPITRTLTSNSEVLDLYIFCEHDIVYEFNDGQIIVHK